MKEYQAAVIGGGPAGITATLYMLRAGSSVVWLERMAPGGQVLRTDWIDNYPGFPEGVKGYELIDLMTKHLEAYSCDKRMDEVRSIEPKHGANLIDLGDEQILAKTVILATGAEYKKLGIPGEEEFVGRGVSYCALCDGQFFKDQVVSCVGGGNTALQEALYLSELASHVYLIHRRDAFRGDKVYQDKVLAESKIEILYDTVPEEIVGQQQVDGLKVRGVKSGEERQLETDGVFLFVGIKPQIDFAPAELERDAGGFIHTDTEMRTSLPGIFAAGDVRSKRCRQVSTAVGDGAAAAQSAHLFLQEEVDV
jgi:thioredoxin reductase (NADPH)